MKSIVLFLAVVAGAAVACLSSVEVFAAEGEKAVSNLDYTLGSPLTLQQREGKPTVESGKATLSFDGKNIVLIADLTDSDIGNSATHNNERTWTTGDVIEFFFQPAGRKDYYEFHVTPNNITLQLHIPSVEELRKTPFEDKFFESHFKTKVKVENGRWTARMEIPAASLGGNVQMTGCRFAVCRYNYNKKWSEPELTSSTPLPTSFHSPDEWHVIR